MLVNLVPIDESRIIIIDRNFHPKIRKSIDYKVHFFPSEKFVRIDVFDQMLEIVFHFFVSKIEPGQNRIKEKDRSISLKLDGSSYFVFGFSFLSE